VLRTLSNRKFVRQQANLAYGQKILPNLIFIRRGERVWALKNIGDGTAFEVAVLNYVSGVLVNLVKLYPISPGEAIRLDYLEGAAKLVAKFQNMYGHDPAYTICEADSNTFSKGTFDTESKPRAVGHESRSKQWPTTRIT
jgi:hypothetical protein